MKILSMNIWDFGGLTKQKSLCSLFTSLKPDMILLQETMCSFSHALNLFSKLKPGWELCSIDSTGLLGGLLLGWNPLLIGCKAFTSYAGILLKANFKGIS